MCLAAARSVEECAVVLLRVAPDVTNPTVKSNILVSAVETGYVAYDPATDTLHQLNPLAALIAELCDGSRTVDEIRGLVGPLMPEDRAGEVDQWIANALQAGLLIPAGGGAESVREFSAAELYDLVGRLKDYGKMQTAYICAKRVVELDPVDWLAWYLLGDLCQYVGKREEARHAFQKYFAAHPDDAEIEHLLVALQDETPPERASDRTIQHIYKGFARSFDGRLVDDLKYQGPERLSEVIEAVIGQKTGLSVVDLGCGSGLAGLRLKSLASTMIGVDLSPEMLDLARKREIYDRLEPAEITTWLEESRELFDLIASCDCLIYFGDLHRITAAAARRLKPNGIFAFTLERGSKIPFHLTDTGRYEHHPDHVREVAAATGLVVARLDEAFLRYEYTAEVIGLFAVLQRADHAPVQWHPHPK
jgi:predicted TPR repeat methyltransferase